MSVMLLCMLHDHAAADSLSHVHLKLAWQFSLENHLIMFLLQGTTMFQQAVTCCNQVSQPNLLPPACNCLMIVCAPGNNSPPHVATSHLSNTRLSLYILALVYSVQVVLLLSSTHASTHVPIYSN